MRSVAMTAALGLARGPSLFRARVSWSAAGSGVGARGRPCARRRRKVREACAHAPRMRCEEDRGRRRAGGSILTRLFASRGARAAHTHTHTQGAALPLASQAATSATVDAHRHITPSRARAREGTRQRERRAQVNAPPSVYPPLSPQPLHFYSGALSRPRTGRPTPYFYNGRLPGILFW